MSNTQQTQSYSFRLPVALKQRVDMVVRQRGQTKSGFLKVAIEKELRRTAQQEEGEHEAR